MILKRFQTTIWLTLLFSIGAFAFDGRPSNIPKDWPEECTPKECKRADFGPCRNVNSKCHKINQNYDGYRPYMKDQNIWIVTPAFAKTFGMEDEHVSHELTGVEAVAYKLEYTYIDCGYGGNEKACMKNTHGLLEVYIDEKKTPLPWLHPEQMVDRHAFYDSTWFLRTDKPRDDYQFADRNKIVINDRTKSDYRLRPFADPVTKHEAAYFQSKYISNGDVWQAISNGILSYKRNAIEGLTVISFYHRMGMDASFRRDRGREFKLASNFSESLGLFSKDTKIFHTFFIPETFIQKIEEIDKISMEKNGVFFKQVFEDMNKRK